MSIKPVLLSGMAPSGIITIGNYIGALSNWVNLQKTHDCYFIIVDLHAITVKQDPETLRERTFSFLAQYIAAGINTDLSTVFLQSHVSAHSELSWILSCNTYFGELCRMTQFKDKSQKNETNINTGLFTYPVLMASDILLYQTNLVPVGSDQKQHLELARNIALRFNNTYGETFQTPEPFITKFGSRIMNLQDPLNKMDKSNSNANTYIALLDEPEVIVKKIKKAVTDSEGTIRYCEKRQGISNLISIYSAFSNDDIGTIENKYTGEGYAKFKKDLAELIVDKLKPIRETYHNLIQNKDHLQNLLQKGALSAKKKAEKTLSSVQEKIGLVPKI